MPTTQMPAQAAFTGTAAAGAAGGAVYGDQYGTEYGVAGEPDEPLPWYQQRGPLIAAIVGGVLFLILALLLGIWFFGGGDDLPSTANRLFITATDEEGQPLDREYTVTVIGLEGSPTSFLWLTPPNSLAPEPATTSPDGGGEAVFTWAPTEEVGDLTRWLSNATITTVVPVGWRLPDQPIPCSLERRDQANSVVELTYEGRQVNNNKERTVTYEFLEYTFVPGDTVRCALAGVAPGATTTTSTTTTSTTSTSTTTTTTEPPPTDPPVTDPPPTVPPTDPPPTEPPPTVPPTEPPPTDPPPTVPPTENAWEIIQAQPDLSEFVALSVTCSWDTYFSDPDRTFTLFAPDNDALDIPDPPDCTDLNDTLFDFQVHEDNKLTLADINGMDEIDMANEESATVVVGDPTTVGDAQILTPDLNGTNGMTHIVDAVLVTG